MKKNLKKIFLVSIILTILSPMAQAEEMFLKPPSLDAIMKQNEQQAIEQAKNLNTTPQKSEKPTIDLTYRKIFEGKAIKMWRANEAMLWVQEIDLSKGAKVDSHLEVVSYNEETGEPQYVKKSITETLSSLAQKPTSLINGQFFNPKAQPTELSFGLKQGELMRSAGADNRNSRKNILRVNGQSAQIVPYSWENLRDSEGNFAMVNFTIDNKSYTNKAIGRTYMCLKNPDKNNSSSKILTFVATDITETEIEKEIFKHGCTAKSTSQLDSSGSSRIWYQDNFVFGAAHKGEPDKRKIPHYVLFYDAE